MKHTNAKVSALGIAHVSVMLVMTLLTTNVFALDMKVPANAHKPGKIKPNIKLPLSNPLSGPLSDASIGQTMMQVEAEPPVKTRGAGSTRLERLFAARCRSVVFIAHKKDNGKVGTGTGSIVSIDGHILTAAHVVAGSKAVAVGIFPSCKPGAQPEFFPAKVVRFEASKDLALLQLTKLPADIAIMPLGKLKEVRTGSSIIIIGHPQNLFMSLSQGTVSAIRPNFKFLRSRAMVIQTDGALNPGNSGGPMMSEGGSLIGVNSFIRGKASAGLNFAVAVTEVHKFLSLKNKIIAAATKPVVKKAACKPKRLKEWHRNKTKVIRYDLACDGKNIVHVGYPDDKSKNPFMLMDRNKDGKSDVIIILSLKGVPLHSEWDDDFDGEYDYRGKHTKGNWKPDQRVRI